MNMSAGDVGAQSANSKRTRGVPAGTAKSTVLCVKPLTLSSATYHPSWPYCTASVGPVALARPLMRRLLAWNTLELSTYSVRSAGCATYTVTAPVKFRRVVSPVLVQIGVAARD